MNLKLSNYEPADDPKDLRLFKIDSRLNFPIMHLELADQRYTSALNLNLFFCLCKKKKKKNRLLHSY